MYIGSFCPAMASLSRFLEEATFRISISSSVFIFLWFFSWCIKDIVYSISFISCPSLRTLYILFCIPYFLGMIARSSIFSFQKCLNMTYQPKCVGGMRYHKNSIYRQNQSPVNVNRMYSGGKF